jgi:hypothetical protein
MKPGRPALPNAATAAAANLGAREAQRATDTHEDARRRLAVLSRGVRFAHSQNQASDAASISPQARKRRAKLPPPRKSRRKALEDDHAHAPSHEPQHGTARRRDNGGENSHGGDGQSQHGHGGNEDGGPGKPLEIRSVATAPVPPHTGGTLPVASARSTDVEHAESVRTAFCGALLALRNDPHALRVVRIAELQLDRLDAMAHCQSLRTPERMSALRQRLIDATKGQPGKTNPFNCLIPLVLLERPLTATGEKESRNRLNSLRNATLARTMRSR